MFLGSTTLESAVWWCIDLDSDFVVTHNKDYFNGNIIETVVIRFVAEHIQLCVSKHFPETVNGDQRWPQDISVVA